MCIRDRIISIRHLSQSELTLMGVRQNKNFGIKIIQKWVSSRDTVAWGVHVCRESESDVNGK